MLLTWTRLFALARIRFGSHFFQGLEKVNSFIIPDKEKDYIMANSQDTLDIETEKLFPSHFRVVGWILMFMSLVVLLYAPLAFPVVLIIGLVLLTGYTGVIFDKAKKRYRIYNSILWIKMGTWYSYNRAIKIFINTRKTSQFLYTRVTTGSTIRSREFIAFVKLEDEEKVFLMGNINKDKLLKALDPAKAFFQLEIEDYS